ncbi:MAG TPA: nucleotidyltransferase substrate binding protein [Stellaceae bacterium]|jgi:uncharacterized protein YutE (UPF0331/DUF86 family)|nr:nucleotidyltransferase substrate binding protein [Stellaceae bacterium]
MARLAIRLAEAKAALATLDEAVGRVPRSLAERDGAILRLIYTYEAVWKACQQLLDEREDIEVASPNTAIRAARRLGWLSDADADAAMRIGRDRNLAVHMYRGQIGTEIEERLPGHAAVLHRWLDALEKMRS